MGFSSVIILFLVSLQLLVSALVKSTYDADIKS